MLEIEVIKLSFSFQKFFTIESLQESRFEEGFYSSVVSRTTGASGRFMRSENLRVVDARALAMPRGDWLFLCCCFPVELPWETSQREYHDQISFDRCYASFSSNFIFFLLNQFSSGFWLFLSYFYGFQHAIIDIFKKIAYLLNIDVKIFILVKNLLITNLIAVFKSSNYV